jgi:hypothetical protein
VYLPDEPLLARRSLKISSARFEFDAPGSRENSSDMAAESSSDALDARLQNST